MKNKTIGVIIMVLAALQFAYLAYAVSKAIALTGLSFNMLLSLGTTIATPAIFFLIGLFIAKHN